MDDDSVPLEPLPLYPNNNTYTLDPLGVATPQQNDCSLLRLSLMESSCDDSSTSLSSSTNTSNGPTPCSSPFHLGSSNLTEPPLHLLPGASSGSPTAPNAFIPAIGPSSTSPPNSISLLGTSLPPTQTITLLRRPDSILVQTQAIPLLRRQDDGTTWPQVLIDLNIYAFTIIGQLIAIHHVKYPNSTKCLDANKRHSCTSTATPTSTRCPS